MFKIIFKLFTLIILILALNLESGGNLKGEGSHCFYLYSQSSSAKIKSLTESQSDNFFYLKQNLKGESVEFFNKENAKSLLNDLNATLVFTEEGEDFYCEYYYSNEIKNFVLLGGRKINVHLAYNKNVITVGSPMIFGSF